MFILKMKSQPILKVVFMLTLLLSFSCSKDDDDSDNDTSDSLFETLSSDLIGEYTGLLTFQSTDAVGPTLNSEGTATITSTGDAVYTITFSDDVPEITDLRFIVSDGEYTSASTSGSIQGISISDGMLSVGVTDSGNNWSFSGSN